MIMMMDAIEEIEGRGDEVQGRDGMGERERRAGRERRARMKERG